VTSAGADLALGNGTGAPAGARDLALDRMKGLLIALVVIGHLVSGSVALTEQTAWYGSLRTLIYLFHMPAFFFVSGILFAMSLQRGQHSPGNGMLRAADRLLVPFVVVGLALFLGKYLAHFLIPVDNLNAQGSFAEALGSNVLALFVFTDQSPATSIWFLFAYFLCLCVGYPLSRLKHGTLVMLAITALLYVMPRVQIAYLNLIADSVIFFALGWIYKSRDGLPGWLRQHVPSWTIGLVLFLLLVPALAFPSLNLVWRMVFGTGASLLILWQMELATSQLLVLLGQSSMMIYVLNTPIIGLVRAGFLEFGMFEQAFIAFLIVAAILAIAVPVALRRWPVSQFRILSHYLK
jgi:fucose 4-O-acetylase-like acetyltransferase